MTRRNSQVSRLYAIIGLLEGAPHGLSAADICKRLNDRGHDVGKRTVYRDLQALGKAGFPVFEEGLDEVNAQRWKLNRSTRNNDYLVLSVRELLALYFARSPLNPLKDTFFYADLDAAFRKIEEKLGPSARGFFDELSTDIAFEPGPRWSLGLDPEVVETVQVSCTEKSVLRVDYVSAHSGERRTRRQGAHFAHFGKGSLYLVAEDLEAKALNVYAVARMSEASLEDEKYATPPIDPEEFFAGSFGVFRGEKAVAVKVRFASAIAPYVPERRRNASQCVVARADGIVDLHLDVTLTPELEGWILGFEAGAVVLELAGLAQSIEARAAEIVDVYRSRKNVA